MNDPGRRDQSSVGARRGRRIGIIAAVVAVGLAIGEAPVIGGSDNQVTKPNTPLVVGTVPATKAQVTSAGATTSRRSNVFRRLQRRIFVESRITDSAAPLEVPENQGSFVGIRCPRGSIAISGGMLSSYINLLISSSAPNNPITGKYTPRIWWVSVTNANIDGRGGTPSYRGVVNCMTPVRLKR